MQPSIAEMTFIEFLTIYLAIGAPFGVYFFFKTRERRGGFSLFVKSVGAALFWIFFAARLLQKHFTSAKSTRLAEDLDFAREREIEAASQNLQTAFAALTAQEETISFFEFREVVERYIGLILAAQNSAPDAPATQRETEIFRIAEREKDDLRLAGKILRRKNYLRLQAHQHAARQDFLQIFRLLRERFPSADLNGKLAAWQTLQTEALRLSTLLEDKETIRALRKLQESSQLQKQITVQNVSKEEKNLWEILQPSTSTPLSAARKLTETAHD